MKWYEQNFVNHRDWILDHLELLGLDGNETILVLLIDFLNEHHLPITLDVLCKKTGMTNEMVNEILSLLCAKKYLTIFSSVHGASFHLDGLFDTNTANNAAILDSSLYDTFETEFGRLLSQKEMQKISEWNRTTDKKLILYALREASAYQKLSTEYVDKILSDWKKKGKTVEDIEAGKLVNNEENDNGRNS